VGGYGWKEGLGDYDGVHRDDRVDGGEEEYACVRPCYRDYMGIIMRNETKVINIHNMGDELSKATTHARIDQ
jgi:hypothetical protein